ncbi:MAG: CCA tRNA nucleotidyltransferase [Lachnospiraceae bacterium]|nr:CCA tRNA nucleotidyltransferase [Lachnospiraceae bacterium]
MKINIPEQAVKIINVLEQAGFEAYVVGGCVRDSLLKKEPKDWDITTSAKPEQVKALFSRTIDTGIEHGTVTVMMDKVGYEVTTYREDGEYKDHRRPMGVTFTSSLKDDLKRRDFTINAMAYNETEGLVDLFGGKEDLEHGILRCVGEAKDRFDEDALRILRALRFSTQLNFELEEKTKEAMREKCVFLEDISAERIQVELTKLLVSGHPEKLLTGYELGITKVVLPEFDAMIKTPQNHPYHCYNVGLHTMEVVKNIEPEPVLRWAALLHDVAKPKCRTQDEKGVDHFYGHEVQGEKMAAEVIKRMKLDNHTLHDVCTLVRHHDDWFQLPIRKSALKRKLNKIGPELFSQLLKLNKADSLGQAPQTWEEKDEYLKQVRLVFDEVMQEEECFSLKDLAVSGADLIAAGIKPGKEMGELLKELLEEVISHPENNQKEILLDLALSRYEK